MGMASSRVFCAVLNNLKPTYSSKSALITFRKQVKYSGVFHTFCTIKQHGRKLSNYGGGGNTPFRRSHAQELIVRMSADERSILLEELQNFETAGHSSHQGSNNNQIADVVQRPSGSQLRGVAMLNAIPFIGFGFLDNFIMIVAGDYIDLTIGVTLGISTMAAAALGNLISDVAGVGSAWYVESLSAKVGIKAPVLTPEQLSMGATTWCIYLGRALGVSIGCFLGMMPLLFLHPKERSESHPDS